MNGRERKLAAIRHQVPDRIPTDVIWIENGEQVAAMLGIRPEEVRDAFGIDGCLVGAGYKGPARHGEGVSEFGTAGTCDYGTQRGYYPLAGAESVGQVERFAWPEPADYDYEGGARAARDVSARYAVRGPWWYPLFCRVCDMMGMEEAMTAMLWRPRVFEAALECTCRCIAGYCERLLDACGDDIHILCLEDDFATQRGLMISPEAWRRFLKPRYARLFDIGKRRGKFIWFHSCGDITSVLPDLIDIGMDVWETVQLHVLPMPPEELKRQFGRHITFFGGVNTQRLPFQTPEEVRAGVVRSIEALGEGGGYICGPDHHVKPDVPAANAVALFEAARSFRRAGYTLA